MPRVTFTQNIQRHVPCPAAQAEGATVREVLERVFATNPAVRTYVLDDQGAVRRHMVVFVNGRQIRDRARSGTVTSAPATAARRGSWWNRCGATPSGGSGSAAARSCPACIRSA